MTGSLPRASVLVPMRDEERWIGPCLDSILANRYPADRMEVLVIDGGSADRSREIVAGYAARDPRVRLLHNPRRIAAAALNVGLAAASGEVVVRADAHTTYAPDYVATCVELLERTGAVTVGGPQRASGDGYLGRVIAAATTSRFGAGDARFRYSEREEWVDTVYLGAWRRETLDAAGGFDEAAFVNEDYELSYRLRTRGGRVLLSPRLRSDYRVRPSLGALARQYFGYGRARVRTLRLHPRSLRWRHLPAPALVLGLAASPALRRVGRLPALAVPAAYAAATLAASARVAARQGWAQLPALPVVFSVIHLSWGAGFWVEMATRHPAPHAVVGTRRHG